MYVDQNETEITHRQEVIIDLTTGKLEMVSYENVSDKLAQLHSRLQIKYGSFQDEYPEQLMTMTFLTGKETVLEIGGNIGRNSLIIASLLTDSRRLVTLESSPEYANQLEENRDRNSLNFFIEASALSQRPLVQRGWETIPAISLIIPGWTPVATITYEQLCKTYELTFDTLILDCEGAFYHILRDTPQILDTIKMVIMENDYAKIEEYDYVKSELLKNNFSVVYERPLFENGVDISHTFYKTNFFFYQVWRR